MLPRLVICANLWLWSRMLLAAGLLTYSFRSILKKSKCQKLKCFKVAMIKIWNFVKNIFSCAVVVNSLAVGSWTPKSVVALFSHSVKSKFEQNLWNIMKSIRWINFLLLFSGYQLVHRRPFWMVWWYSLRSLLLSMRYLRVLTFKQRKHIFLCDK